MWVADTSGSTSLLLGVSATVSLIGHLRKFEIVVPQDPAIALLSINYVGLSKLNNEGPREDAWVSLRRTEAVMAGWTGGRY